VNEEENTSITAVVVGGSGQYAFNWAVYTLDTYGTKGSASWERGFRERGTSRTAGGSTQAP